MFKKTLLAAIAMTLTAGAVHADEKLSKPQGAGMATGAVAGAVVGGPVGAFVGLIVGGVIGEGVHKTQQADRRAQSVEDELLETRRELAAASERADSEALLASLALTMRSEVLFKTGSAQLDWQVQEELGALGKLMSSHPRLAVKLHGFADPRGRSVKNLQLSMQRAEQVKLALVNGGALAEQIEIAAHGEEASTAAKNDIEAYAWERRVSLVLLPSSAANAVAQTN